jgi:hypothetical protein
MWHLQGYPRSMPEVTATELARGVRSATYRTPARDGEPPPAFLVMPTTVGRKAVQLFHAEGAVAARTYLGDKLEDWLGHTNPSMRGNATNTLRALDTYISADSLDSRAFVGHGANVVLSLPSGTVKTRVDVVMTRERELSGRAVFWDGEPITLNDAAVIAYPYAQALQLMYPDETITDICVWQVRRGNLHVVPVAEALARAGEADAVLARL